MDRRLHPRPFGARRLNLHASRALALLVAAAVSLGGCGSSSRPGGLRVVDAWTRPLPPSSTEASIYLTVENPGDVADRLLGGESTRCMALTLHRSSTDAAGSSSMQPATGDEAVIAAGGRLALVPNGLHLMCSGLAEPLVAGATFEIVVGFEHAAAQRVEVTVEDR